MENLSPGAAGAANAAASRNQLEAALAPWDFYPGVRRGGKNGGPVMICRNPVILGG